MIFGIEENDGQRGGEGQLKPEIEELERIEEEDDKSAQADGVEQMGILPEELSEKKGDAHDGRPDDGRPAFDEKGVENEEDDQQDVGDAGRNAEEFQEAEDHEEGNHADMGAGDGEKMERPVFCRACVVSGVSRPRPPRIRVSRIAPSGVS